MKFAVAIFVEFSLRFNVFVCFSLNHTNKTKIYPLCLSSVYLSVAQKSNVDFSKHRLTY